MSRPRIRACVVAAAIAVTAAVTTPTPSPAAAASTRNPYCDTASVRALIRAEYSEAPWFVAWADRHLRVVVGTAPGGATAGGRTITFAAGCAQRSAASGRYTALHEAAHLLDFWALTPRLPGPTPAGVNLDPTREQALVVPVSTWQWGGDPVTVVEYGRTRTIPRVEWFADCVVRVLTGGRVLGGYTHCPDRAVWSTVLSLAAGSYRTDIVWQSGTGLVIAHDRARGVNVGSWPV